MPINKEAQEQTVTPARIIKHSKHRDTELITVEVELHRFVLAQNNTHRSLSRNYQSSRAMPILKQLEQIKNNPAMPIYYGTAKQGMVAGEELEGDALILVKDIILSMRDFCLASVEMLQKVGLSKEIANRYVEPWMYTKGIVTATKKDWEAFIKLRSEYDAQPEIRVVSDAIRDAIAVSVPEELYPCDWHLPYVDYKDGEYSINGVTITLQEAIITSTAACAQISYRTLNLSEEKIKRIYEMLKLPEGGVYPKEAPHFSAAEHQAMAITLEQVMSAALWSDVVIEDFSGNFHTDDFLQYRKALEQGVEQYFISLGC